MDLHVHSTCSSDGGSSIMDYALQARRAGLTAIGFCEHADFDPRDQGYGYLDMVRYDQELHSAREHVPEVLLLQAIEITYQAGLEGQIRDWLSGHAWDYVLASVHLVDYEDGWALVSEPGTANAYYGTHTCRQAYLAYFEELLRAARSGLADVLGHLDLVKRYGTAHYGPFEPRTFSAEIRSVLRAAVEAGMGLEINTSGLRQAPGEPYPALEVLRWYLELGGQIVTIGSDAHRVQDLGASTPEALDLVRAAGFRAVAYYQDRQVRWVDL
ncbi:MAG: histidinol-phosphatase HisJ family protein [Anaerolineae bacterium]|nr:histidinol-phosphatase HisJ family protein [Anaerolineae bacterium]